MFIRHQLTFLGQPRKWLFLEVSVIPVDKVEDLRLQDKERSVDPAFFRLRLFREFGDLIAVHFQVAKARRRPHSSQRGQLAVGTVKRQQIVQVDV